MIFQRDLVELVLTGRKTVTRRRQVHRDGRPLRYKERGVYAVQPGRGKHHVGHLQVLAITAEPLGMISHDDAQREGFAGPEEFIDRWAELHGSFDQDEVVIRIAFARAPDCPDCRPHAR